MSWPLVKLEDVFDIARGGSPRPIDEFITDEADGLNWISIKDASNSDKYIEKTKLKIKKEGLSKSRFVKPGDFLLTNSMSFGRPYIMKTSGCIHDGWLVLSGDLEMVFPDYFYYLFGSETLHRKFASLAAGAVVKNLNINLVKSVEIPLPPLEEQKRIAAMLDKADAIRQKRKQAIQLADDFLRSVFLDMFGDPVTNPKGWEVKAIGELCTVSSGSTPSRKNEEYYKGNIPWVKTGEIDGYVITDTEEHISEDAIKETSCKLNPKGSLLIAMYGQGKTRGKVGILGVNAATNQACAVLKPSNAINMTYLYHYIKLSYEKLRELGQGAGQPNLNSRIVKEFEILIPDTEKQKKFVNIAERIEALKYSFESGMVKTNINFNSISQKAFAGEL